MYRQNREQLFLLIDSIVNMQEHMVVHWHNSMDEPVFESDVMQAAYFNHLMNFKLWHEEDKARRKDVQPNLIAECKRNIDVFKQKRTDAYEKLDQLLVNLFIELVPSQHSDMQNTESVGMALDRLSIIALKIYHIAEHLMRTDLSLDKLKQLEHNLQIMRRQKDNLVISIKHLIDEYILGLKIPGNFYQFKMYNDPTLNPEIYKNV